MKKFLGSASVGIIAVLLFAGCAPSAEQKALEADCDLVATRMAKFIDVLDTDLIEGWSWPAGYAVTNAGTASRETTISDAVSLYPFFPSAIEKLLATNPDSTSYDYREGDMASEAVRLEYLQTVLSGTQFEFKLTPEETALVYSGTYEGSEVLDQKIDSIFGVAYPETREEAGPCKGITLPGISDLTNSYPYSDSDNLIRDIYNDSREYMTAMGVAYFQSLMCQMTGSFAGDPCASSDYESGPWVPTPRDPFLEPYGDETIQGLAEFTWCYNQGLEVNSSRTGCW